MQSNNGGNQQQIPEERFPFDGEFQKSLLRLLMEDGGFASIISSYLKPEYFENEVLGWIFSFGQRYKQTYNAWPSARVYYQQIRQMDPRLAYMYSAVVEQITQSTLRDELWMRDAVLDFVKRNIFVKTFHESKHLYNEGKVAEAYDLMMARMEKIARTTWEPVDRGDFYSELPGRHNTRMDYYPGKDAVGTGIAALDHILGGGLSLGEMGIVIAYSKCGKSTVLSNLGVASTRLNHKRTLHFVFEGTRQRVEDRYDACLMSEPYNLLKKGELTDTAKYSDAYELYQTLRGYLFIRGFKGQWDYSVSDIHEELKSLKREMGWTPELIIVDYGDLIYGRDKNTSDSETEKQKKTFRDLATLARAGFALWTASQAQRPGEGAEDKEHIIRARQIADCYEKVRVADLLCSHNVTRMERQELKSRLYVELYRENEAEKQINMHCDFSQMTIKQADHTQLGYNVMPQPQQKQQAQPQQVHTGF